MERRLNPVLQRLEAFVGEWVMTIPSQGETLRGQVTFEWGEEGAFLVQRANIKVPETAPAEWVSQSPFPTVAIIGLDDASESFAMLYADARGVFRVYQMSLEGGTWRIWRDTPGFAQRFTGTFSPDGNKITAAWEKSGDGSRWEHDFDMIYSKRR